MLRAGLPVLTCYRQSAIFPVMNGIAVSPGTTTTPSRGGCGDRAR